MKRQRIFFSAEGEKRPINLVCTESAVQILFANILNGQRDAVAANGATSPAVYYDFMARHDYKVNVAAVRLQLSTRPSR